MKRTLLLILLLIAALPVRAQTPTALMQEALRLERSAGDYEGAIALYRRIAENTSADRRLVAQALIQLGKAYESLGRTEAFSAYDRVAREFADQADLVAEARVRMRGLSDGAAGPGAAPTLLINPELTFEKTEESSFSRDGRYFVNTNWKTHRLGYQEVGADEIIYFDIPAYNTTPISARFSPDMRRIAYATDDSTGAQHLALYDLQDRSTRIIRSADGNWYFEVYDWTSDGSAILVMMQRGNNRQSDLALVDVASGDIRFTQSLVGEFSWRACLLDDRYALYQYMSAANSDIGRIDLVTGDQEDFLPEESGKSLGGCSDRQHVVAVQTDLFGETQAWLYPVVGGRPSGQPTPLLDLRPDDRVTALSDRGDVFYESRPWHFTTALYPFDKENWTISGRGTALPGIMALPGQLPQARPSWNADGSRLAYPIGFNTALIRERDGSTHAVQMDANVWVGSTWSSDGTAIVASQWSEDTRSHSLVGFDPWSGAVVTRSPVIPPETKMGAFRKDANTTCIIEISRVPPGLRDPSQLHDLPDLDCYEDSQSERTNGAVRIPPTTQADGTASNQAIVMTHYGANTVLTLFDVAAMSTRVLLDGPEWGARGQVLPDGSVIMTRDKDGALYLISVNGGSPVPMFSSFTELNKVASISVSPTMDQVLIMSSPRGVEKPASADIKVLRGAWELMGGRK